jgi:hypothetical protein
VPTLIVRAPGGRVLEVVEEDQVGSSRRVTVGLMTAVALLAAALGTQMAFAQADEGANGPGDEQLLERLDALEGQLPTPAPPTGIEIDPEETWGTIEGDFGGPRATLDTVAPELESLFTDADDGETVVADAVASVARGWLDLREAYTALADWEANDLAFPLDATDDEDVATGADEVRGDAERGLRHVLVAHDRHLEGYVLLREQGAAPDAAMQSRLDARAAQAEEFDEEIRPLIHRLLSLPTTMLIVPTQRFETSAPGVEARARAYTITCVDREAYAEAAAGVDAGDVPSAEETPELLEPRNDRLDCPDLPEGVEGDPFTPTDEDDGDEEDDTDVEVEVEVETDDDSDVEAEVEVEADDD